MSKPDLKSRERALAIEYWIATLFVIGAFIVGLTEAFAYFL